MSSARCSPGIAWLIATIALFLLPRVGRADDCVDLMGCQWCRNATEQTAHKFSTAGANSCNGDEYNPYHDTWVFGSECSDDHNTCSIGLLVEHVARTTVMIAARDARGLANYAMSFPGAVTINFERMALQLRGCGGKVVAHFPVPAETVTAIRVAWSEGFKRAVLGRPAYGIGPTSDDLSFAEYLGLATS